MLLRLSTNQITRTLGDDQSVLQEPLHSRDAPTWSCGQWTGPAVLTCDSDGLVGTLPKSPRGASVVSIRAPPFTGVAYTHIPRV